MWCVHHHESGLRGPHRAARQPEGACVCVCFCVCVNPEIPPATLMYTRECPWRPARQPDGVPALGGRAVWLPLAALVCCKPPRSLSGSGCVACVAAAHCHKGLLPLASKAKHCFCCPWHRRPSIAFAALGIEGQALLLLPLASKAKHCFCCPWHRRPSIASIALGIEGQALLLLPLASKAKHCFRCHECQLCFQSSCWACKQPHAAYEPSPGGGCRACAAKP